MSNGWRRIRTQIERTATAKGRAASGCYAIEGTRLHERALRAGARPSAVLIANSVWSNPGEREASLLHRLQQQDIPVHPIPNSDMDQLTQGRRLGGMIGLLPLPQPISLEKWLSGHPAPTLIVAVDIVDPGNVGSMMRTAHALGADLFVTVGGSDPFHPRAVRTSMGSIFKVPALTASLPFLLATLRAAAIQTVGTAAENGITLPNFWPHPGGTAVFMGNEYRGLSDELKGQMDTLVTIPMAAGIDSFSVNAASAIVLYHLRNSVHYPK